MSKMLRTMSRRHPDRWHWKMHKAPDKVTLPGVPRRGEVMIAGRRYGKSAAITKLIERYRELAQDVVILDGDLIAEGLANAGRED